jgi:uncharacterized RDD family membrane protein YckC
MTAASGAVDPSRLPTPTIKRRLVVMAYEVIVLAAMLLIAALPFTVWVGGMAQSWQRPLLQVYFLFVLGAYFCHFWRKSGQTLAMQTWRVKLVGKHDAPLTWRGAISRFLLVAVLFVPVAMLIVMFTKYRSSFPWLPWLIIPAAASIIWARFDADGQFLHDRLLGTRLVQLPKAAADKGQGGAT